MPLWLVPLSLAGEPVGVPGPDVSAPGALRDEVVLAWSTVGFAPAAPESPAIGPSLLALGPDGRAAVYDPLGRRVIVVGAGAFPVGAAADLAFTSAGVLLVMDDAGRSLRAYAVGGKLLGERAFPGIVPPGGSLGLDGDIACSIDPFGNCHPLAEVSSDGALGAAAGPGLRPPERRVVNQGGALLVDGHRVATLPGRGGGRILGDWLLVETMDEGTATRRAVPLDGGATVALPVRGRLYAPARDVAVSPDGDLGWIDPRTDGLHLVRVAR
jgi:hypothetical protein